MLDLGRVTAVHPDGHSVDVMIIDGGRPLSGVRVMSLNASGNSGLNDLPQCSVNSSVDKPASESIGEREMVAVIGYFSGLPICLGFLFPSVSQMLFADPNRKVDRHASDVYETIDGNGNYEWYHPSGTFLRVAESSAHEDLTGKDFDGKWKITKNTGRAPHVHLEVKNAGSTVAVLDIDPSGNVTESNVGNLSASVGENLSATVSGTASLTSGGAMSLTAPSITMNAPDIVLNGKLTQGRGSNGGECVMLGPLNVTNDVTAGGISLMHHKNSGVVPGGGLSGEPV